jgi:hypothetical protein
MPGAKMSGWPTVAVRCEDRVSRWRVDGVGGGVESKPDCGR